MSNRQGSTPIFCSETGSAMGAHVSYGKAVCTSGNACLINKGELEVMLHVAGASINKPHVRNSESLHLIIRFYRGMVISFFPLLTWRFVCPDQYREDTHGVATVFLLSLFVSVVDYFINGVYLRRLHRRKVVKKMIDGLPSRERLLMSFGHSSINTCLQHIENPELISVLVEYRDDDQIMLDRKTQQFQAVIDEAIVRLLNNVTLENKTLLSSETLGGLARILKIEPSNHCKNVRERHDKLFKAIVRVANFCDDLVLEQAVSLFQSR